MSAQNLVSAVLSPEVSAAVTQGLTDIRTKLDFLVVLLPEQKNQFVKVGNTYSGFIKKSYDTIMVHPEVMSNVFNLDEFKKDYQLSQDLIPILHQVQELSESIEETLFAVSSDAMSESLEVYAAVQMNKDKIPGMDAIASEMAGFFKKPKRKAATAQPQATK